MKLVYFELKKTNELTIRPIELIVIGFKIEPHTHMYVRLTL